MVGRLRIRVLYSRVESGFWRSDPDSGKTYPDPQPWEIPFYGKSFKRFHSKIFQHLFEKGGWILTEPCFFIALNLYKFHIIIFCYHTFISVWTEWWIFLFDNCKVLLILRINYEPSESRLLYLPIKHIEVVSNDSSIHTYQSYWLREAAKK